MEGSSAQSSSRIHRQYFPAEYAAIDWSQEPQWCDKELSQVLAEAGRRNREVDVLVKVQLLSGGDQWILLHLEIQTAYEEDFAQRISRYNSGLEWVFQRRVATLAVLADLRRDWRPDEDLFQFGRFERRVRFPICKLIENLNSPWRDDHSLPVLLARAQVEALRTSGDAEERYRAKWLLVRGLYDLGHNAKQVRETFRLIDWIMHLRIDLEEQFQQELTTFEEERKMPYVTSIERLGIAKGFRDACLILLTEICGGLPEVCEKRVRTLSDEQLEQLIKDQRRFQSLADLESWLEQHAAAGD